MKVVEYHSGEWEKLTFDTHRTNTGLYGWVTWEVFEARGIRLAVMKWMKF